MIKYPRLKPLPSARQTVDAFKGYNHNLRIGAGEFYEMENMTSDDYPVLSVRKKRGRHLYSLQAGGRATGMLYVPGVGLFIAVNQQAPQDSDEPEEGALHLLRADGEISLVVHSLLAGWKSLALMGKHLIVAPDMRWVNTDDLSCGSIIQSEEITEGSVRLNMYLADGTPLHKGYPGVDPPGDPQSYSHWVDTSVSPPRVMRYSVPQGKWVEVEHTMVQLEADGMDGSRFSIGDTVNITGLTGKAANCNGLHTITERPNQSAIIVEGMIEADVVQSCEDYPVKIERTAPRLDFLVEWGNRLWGCSRNTNEIYACKLGDYKNWNCFQGLSTDSWVGSIGTPGEFTGAVVQSGYPVFYKETCKHKVWPSATGAHQITTAICHGVEKGSETSLAVCDGTVFYKSALGVFADDGGGAVEIGQPLGDVRYRNGVGAAHDRKYYLSMEDSTGKRTLFVYDIARRMWHCENSMPGVLCSAWGSLYCAYGDILDLTGKTGTPEEAVSWMVQTGDLGLESPDQKYISRLTLRLMLEPGATLEIYAQYDREPVWVKLGQIYGTDLRSFSLPVRPRRCDQLRLKLQGKGMCKIYSITKTMVKGSELS